jgi:hypothetical protein
MKTILCMVMIALLISAGALAQELPIKARLLQRWRERIAGFFPRDVPTDSLKDVLFLRKLSQQYPDNLAVYMAMLFADKAFRDAEKERLHRDRTTSNLGKTQLGVLLFQEWLDTNYPPVGGASDLRSMFHLLHEAEKLLEIGFKARRDPFVGYLLAVAYSYDALRETRFQDMRQQLMSVLEHFMPAALVRQITEVEVTQRPDASTVAGAIAPEYRRQVRTVIRTYREWLMLREWVETAEPGKPRVRRQVRPTKEEEQLAKYLEQVIARL